MRSILAILLSAVPTGLALAHTLDADEPLARQLEHQVVGAHHWPLIALTLIVLAAAVAHRRHRRPGSVSHRQK